MARIREYLPHPGQWGILPSRNREKIAKIDGFEQVKSKNVEDTVKQAQNIVERLTKFNPSIVIDREDVERFHVSDAHSLYNKPTDRLVNESPHHVRHSGAVFVHTTFLGNFANGFLPEGNKLNIGALQLASMTHDGFRSQFDVAATTWNYKLHGILAAENLQRTIDKTRLPQPDEKTFALTQEINRYHDVDTRPLNKRSQEVEFFNMIDKFELVRLFHTQDMPKFPYRIRPFRNGMEFLARRRLHMHEGKTELFLSIHRSYLVIAEALYQLSMQDMKDQFEKTQDWNKVDQFESVMRAGEKLRMIRRKEDGQPLPKTQEVASLGA